ncbi:uncharacterized protein LOC129456390 [Periophthalmus magnuspinnatus]|uniref:uncharacterized protein LOC129456390 n=1 Tax=Periophthalmus magnuspinnatus TaxID=409849 RepID=UPI002436E314|nr:uncharacterized protein LOC129456390 [Periophthalmus magnuspinnatus]
MKSASVFLLVFLLLLNISYAHGQQSLEEATNISLRLSFPPFYNSYSKSCCKLYPGGCYLLLNSAGYVCDFLRGRVTQSQGDGWLQFTISNAQFSDQGFYRCTVMGTPIYIDYYVEVKDTSDHLLSHKTTTKAHGIATDLEPTEPVMDEDMSDLPRDPWSFPLPAVVSMAAVICISSLTALVFCCVKAKQKQSNTKHAESPLTDTASVSVKQEHVEISSIVYTTVDFKAHESPTQIYENLRAPKIQEGHRAPQHPGNVEYSTLAVHQHP